MFLYKYYSLEFGLKNISEKRLKLSLIDELNDPFDCFFHVQNYERDFFDYREALGDKIGLLCLSENLSNPVLWSHYADKHRGVALCFEVDEEDFNKVSYVSEPECLYLDNSEVKNLRLDVIFPLIHYKYKFWEYESEYRMLRLLSSCELENNMYWVPFDGIGRLKEVIFGIDAKITKDILHRMVRDYPDIVVKQMVISPDEYLVRPAVLIYQQGDWIADIDSFPL